MGQSQSQEIERFINNNVNTTAIANVISNYATRTNAITTNVQDLCVNIVAQGDIDFGQQGFNASQEIESIINVDTLIDRANTVELVNELQRVVSTELKDSIERVTGGLEIFTIPSNQRLRDEVINNMDSYVSQVINASTLDEVLLSASNVQRGCYNFQAQNVRGPLVITQRIQSNIMAENIVRQVMDVALQNRDVQVISTQIEGQLRSENTAQIPNISSLFGGIAFYIVGALFIIGGIILAYFLPATINAKIITAVFGIIIGIILIAIGFIRGRSLARV